MAILKLRVQADIGASSSSFTTYTMEEQIDASDYTSVNATAPSSGYATVDPGFAFIDSKKISVLNPATSNYEDMNTCGAIIKNTHATAPVTVSYCDTVLYGPDSAIVFDLAAGCCLILPEIIGHGTLQVGPSSYLQKTPVYVRIKKSGGTAATVSVFYWRK